MTLMSTSKLPTAAMSPSHPSIVKSLERHAHSDPNKPAFVFVNESLDRQVFTRQHVWDYSRKFAAVLRKAGLKRGDVVCNTLPNSPQRLFSVLGTITAGCISMGAQSCMADGSDFVSSLNRGKANGVILNSSDTKGLFPILKARLQRYNPTTGDVSCSDVPSLKYVLPYTLGNGSRFLQSLDEEEDMFYEDIEANDICVYMSTSGSSGTVKLVPLNSDVLIGIAETAFTDTIGKVYMCDLDIGWISGFPFCYLAFGCVRVLLDRGCDIPANSADIQWKMAVQEKCQVCFTAPMFMLEFQSVRSRSENVATRNYKLEKIFGGGGSVTKKHVEGAIGEVADALKIFYGSTETGLTAYRTIYNVGDYEDFNTGLPTTNTRVKIVDVNDKELPTGEQGEILIQSNQSLRHYVNDPENTSRTFDPNGWIRLGDMGKVNAKGELYIMGRKKFAISKGTTVFYPEVIETFVRKCPGIKDVAIVGVPDEKLFEEICALVIKKRTSDISEKDVKRFCERMISQDRSMIPQYILFTERLPHTHRGKLDRREVKKLACQKLGL